MCKIAFITLRIDEGLKNDFEKLCANMGTNLSSAITLLAGSCGRNNELPFNLEYNMNWKSSDKVQPSRISIRIEEDKKKRFSEFCEERGISMSMIIKMFMIQCLDQGKLVL